MKDGFDVVSDIYALLDVPEITSTIDGRIWKFYRPAGRTKTDITIRTLFTDNEYIQTSIVNINIHVPNFQANINGIQQSYPNQAEFDRLSGLVSRLLDGRNEYDFWTDVTISGELFDNPDGSYFSRVQVKYQSIQTNFKNI